MAAQLYPEIYTLIPSGLAVGLGGAALWCAKCTYLTIAAEAYSAINRNETKSQDLVVRFFAVFFFFYQTAQVWGNLISSSGECNWFFRCKETLIIIIFSQSCPFSLRHRLTLLIFLMWGSCAVQTFVPDWAQRTPTAIWLNPIRRKLICSL